MNSGKGEELGTSNPNHKKSNKRHELKRVSTNSQIYPALWANEEANGRENSSRIENKKALNNCKSLGNLTKKENKETSNQQLIEKAKHSENISMNKYIKDVLSSNYNIITHQNNLPSNILTTDQASNPHNPHNQHLQTYQHQKHQNQQEQEESHQTHANNESNSHVHKHSKYNTHYQAPLTSDSNMLSQAHANPMHTEQDPASNYRAHSYMSQDQALQHYNQNNQNYNYNYNSNSNSNSKIKEKKNDGMWEKPLQTQTFHVQQPALRNVKSQTSARSQNYQYSGMCLIFMFLRLFLGMNQLKLLQKINTLPDSIRAVLEIFSKRNVDFRELNILRLALLKKTKTTNGMINEKQFLEMLRTVFGYKDNELESRILEVLRETQPTGVQKDKTTESINLISYYNLCDLMDYYQYNPLIMK
jgi:hypothetical protein